MADQKAKARAAWVGTGQLTDEAIWFELADNILATDFLGYETDTAEAQLQKLVNDGVEVLSAKAGDKVQLIFNQTPFYAESGGQVGDTGSIESKNGLFEVLDTQISGDAFIHIGTVTRGSISMGDKVNASINPIKRKSIK